LLLRHPACLETNGMNGMQKFLMHKGSTGARFNYIVCFPTTNTTSSDPRPREIGIRQ
jgi:hypothetical protein